MEGSADLCAQCGCELPPTGTLFLHEGQVVCRDCHDLLNPVCPTCGERLGKKPESTGPCPLCGWPIHVVRDQDVFDTSLLTRDQAERVTELRKKIGILRRYGISEGDYPRTAAQLRQQTGEEPDDVTIMRRLFHLASRHCGDRDADLAVVLYAEAKYLDAHGVEWFHVLRRAHQHRLMALKADGVEAVCVVGPTSTCAYCKKRAGVALPIDGELDVPELPNTDCPNRPAETEIYVEGELHKIGIQKNAFCEAVYEPAEQAE